MIKSNLLTFFFQKYLNSKDIRNFKNNFFYYVFFRLIRNFLSKNIIIKIYNFKVFGSIKKNRTSYFLLKKCEFGDNSELDLIKKISEKKKIIFFDCGCNYGFYSLFTASLSNKNIIVSIDASKKTLNELIKNIKLNNFYNIKYFNNAISNNDNEIFDFNESEKDWESSLNHKNFDLFSTYKIKSIKIDTILNTINYQDYDVVIKLDIEGNEMKAIQGAEKLIQSTSPLIIVEFSKYIFNNINNIKYLKNFLKKYEYSIYDTSKKKCNVNEILMKINSLKKNRNTIGNYYLIKNSLKNKFLEINV